MSVNAWSMALADGATARVWIYAGQIYLDAPKQMSAVDATRLGLGLTEAARRLAQQPPRVRRTGEATPTEIPTHSELACKRCGTYHMLDEFKIGERVVTDEGLSGVVHDWSQYGCPVTVTVDLDGGAVDSFNPCQLRPEPAT